MEEFNINLMKIEDNVKYFEYFSIMASFGYSPNNLRPTRVKGCSATVIDKIWVNFLVKPSIAGFILPVLTDHYPIFIITAYEYATNFNTNI